MNLFQVLQGAQPSQADQTAQPDQTMQQKLAAALASLPSQSHVDPNGAMSPMQGMSDILRGIQMRQMAQQQPQQQPMQQPMQPQQQLADPNNPFSLPIGWRLPGGQS